jgi:hypothetical protein
MIALLRGGMQALLLTAIGSFASMATAQLPGASGCGGPAPSTPGLETGGLAPPSSTPKAAPEARVERGLERAEREDAGRGLELIWVSAGAGYELTALSAVSGERLLGTEISDSGGGPAFHAALGARLIFLSLAASARVTRTGDWDLWMLGGRVGLHLPMGTLESSFALELGYATLSGLEDGALDVGGLGARVAAALDWYVDPLLSLGANLDGSLLVLSRDGGASGEASGVGLGASLSLVAGLHF